MQYTLEKPVKIVGKGLHTGNNVTMTVFPAEPLFGIRFVRTDIKECPEVEVNWQNRLDIPLCTALGAGSAKILTVEHFLAACQGLGLANLRIEINGPELPALDGSALEFYKALLVGGIVAQQPKPKLVLKESIYLTDGQAFIAALPSSSLRLSYTFVSLHDNVPDMFFDYNLEDGEFETQLAPARTIAFREQLEQLRAQGFALGGDENMVVLIDKRGFANERRFSNEVARHKVLDLLGDLTLIGVVNLQAHIIAVGTGHRHNARLVKEIFQRRI